MDDKGCLDLVQAIVMQAVKDWKDAKKKLKKKPDDLLLKSMVEECEKFFKSEYFNNLTGLDGNSILGKLKDESK